MRDLNTFWVSTVARTGSMWATNIIREILKYSNFNVLPKVLLKSDSACVEFYKNDGLLDKNKQNKYVFKIHSKIDRIPPGSKVITTVRNPYDICASFHEFMKCDLYTSIDSALLLLDFYNHYKKLEKDVFVIKYEEIENTPGLLIKNLSSFCEVKLSEHNIEHIIRKYEKNNVKKLIDKNDLNLKRSFSENKKIDEDKIVKDINGNIRSYDLDTGFQSGHISSRKTGDWMKVFSEEEKNIIIKKIDKVAVDLGYKSENN